MPQMAPMNWTFILIFSISIFLMFNFLNYSIFMYSNQPKKTFMKKFHTNWKW